jgi:hypothetical protein
MTSKPPFCHLPALPGCPLGSIYYARHSGRSLSVAEPRPGEYSHRLASTNSCPDLAKREDLRFLDLAIIPGVGCASVIFPIFSSSSTERKLYEAANSRRYNVTAATMFLGISRALTRIICNTSGFCKCNAVEDDRSITWWNVTPQSRRSWKLLSMQASHITNYYSRSLPKTGVIEHNFAEVWSRNRISLSL